MSLAKDTKYYFLFKIVEFEWFQGIVTNGT